jgi:hypothetical protein
MTAVLDNLGSLRRLLGEPMPTIGPTVIARSALEIGAIAWWLMEPGIGTRVRTCRELVLSLTSARRAQQVAKELEDPEGKAEGMAQEAHVLQRVSDLAIASPAGKPFEPQIEGEKCPRATDLTARMLKTCFPAGTPLESFYRSYSAVTHGEFYGLMNFTTPTVQTDGSVLLAWKLQAPVLDSTVQVALLAFREPYRSIRALMGWGRLEDDLWSARLEKIFNGPRRRAEVPSADFECSGLGLQASPRSDRAQEPAGIGPAVHQLPLATPAPGSAQLHIGLVVQSHHAPQLVSRQREGRASSGRALIEDRGSADGRRRAG